MLTNMQPHSPACTLIKVLRMSLLAGLLAGCSLCGNDIGYEEKSPSGKLKAVAFERDCGATTDFTTQISILRGDEKLPNEAGNLFMANGNLKVRIKWEAEDKLVITYPSDAKVGRKQPTQSGVSIRYETLP